jgi:putative transposase
VFIKLCHLKINDNFNEKKMERKDQFDFESFKEGAMQDLYAGKLLMGEQGIFSPLLKHFLEATLQGEMDAHLKENKASMIPNRRSGMGKFELETPRDRLSDYEPTIVPKRQTINVL